MSDARADFAERLVTCGTMVGCCMFALGAVLIGCVALDWTLNRVVRTLRLYSAFIDFMWERRKKELAKQHD
jgi:hypothetical protein